MIDQLIESIWFLGFLALETLDFVLWFWPVSAAMVVIGILGVVVGRPLENARFRTLLPRVAASYLLPVLTLLVGTVLRYELHGPPHPDWVQPPGWFGTVLWLPLVLHAGLVLAALLARTGARARLGAVLLPGVWLSFCALFPAGFAIAGVGP